MCDHTEFIDCVNNVRNLSLWYALGAELPEINTPEVLADGTPEWDLIDSLNSLEY